MVWPSILWVTWADGGMRYRKSHLWVVQIMNVSLSQIFDIMPEAHIMSQHQVI